MTGEMPERAYPEVTVLLGDPRLADETKREGGFHEEDFVSRDRMKEALGGLSGYHFEFLDDHGRLLERLRDDPPAFVLNFCDTGFRNNPYHELHLPALLELYGVPYSGAGPSCMALTYDKAVVRAVAKELGVPVPDEVYLAHNDPGAELPVRYPALIKPSMGDGSQGITKDAMVEDEASARAYLAMLREMLPDRPVLVQEYLPGPEYGVGVIGNPADELRVLPPLEVDFSRLPAGLPPILSFESKTDPDSPYWTEVTFDRAELDPVRADGLKQEAAMLFERFGLRDYGRFDFRADALGHIKLMEVNANPAWAYDGKLAFMASFDGVDYLDMLALILETAQRRAAREARAA